MQILLFIMLISYTASELRALSTGSLKPTRATRKQLWRMNLWRTKVDYLASEILDTPASGHLASEALRTSVV